MYLVTFFNRPKIYREVTCYIYLFHFMVTCGHDHIASISVVCDMFYILLLNLLRYLGSGT